MKRIVTLLVAFALLFGSPTVAMAKGYSGGSGYHSSSGGSHAYSSSGSSLPSSGSTSGTYHSGPSSYSGGSTYRSGSTGSTGTRFGGTYGSGSGFGLGHLASFGGGLLLGSMFHPFGGAFGGGYGGGFGGPGSLIGMIVDLLITGLIIWLIYRIFRAVSRRRRGAVEPIYEGPFTSQSRLFRDLDEQAVVDACCEFVASRQRHDPQEVDVDLTFNRNMETFGADIRIAGQRAYPLSQQDLVDAVSAFVASHERVATSNVNVDLQFDENLGIHASVRIA